MARESVLIVDSDSDLAQIVASFLNFQGHRVQYTNRVREASTKLSLQKYNWIFLDPALDQERGEDVLYAALDPSSLNARTPVILYTKDHSYHLPTDSIVNVRFVLPKPFTFEDIQVAISAKSSALSPT